MYYCVARGNVWFHSAFSMLVSSSAYWNEQHQYVVFYVDFDGLFVSNGPGNPEMCMQTVEQLRLVLAREPVKPVFGICLGHQLLSLAAGATTYKMKSVSKQFCCCLLLCNWFHLRCLYAVVVQSVINLLQCSLVVLGLYTANNAESKNASIVLQLAAATYCLFLHCLYHTTLGKATPFTIP